MTTTEQRTATILPTPRPGAADDLVTLGTTTPAPATPGRAAPRARPPRYYWDVAAAAWRTRHAD
ncbi:hypothetical protein SAMN05660748_2637 [Blastococcus aggregatus]|uniref:Uncharacterized protein n=1 Tax=Blastococcus aggregatus TaxID=38502 RepID=A0A285V7B3_9ACTN|nr:hypothetical protein [Blastococcus aggregatus]SOC49903.1 hypothetical protein SAMN05660748_2637 [Blastococcus aggregatus]